MMQVQKLDLQIQKLIQEQLEYLAHRQISILEWELITRQVELATPPLQCAEILSQEPIPFCKAILYLMQGLLPLLSEFSAQINAHICGQSSECTDAITHQKMQTLFEFSKTLQVRLVTCLCTHFVNYLIGQHQPSQRMTYLMLLVS